MITETYRYRTGRRPTAATRPPRDSVPVPAAAGRRPAPATRQNVVLFGLASVFGMWLALAAPSVSPVAPSAPPPPSAGAATTLVPTAEQP